MSKFNSERRKFIRNLGLGALGLGILTIPGLLDTARVKVSETRTDDGARFQSIPVNGWTIAPHVMDGEPGPVVTFNGDEDQKFILEEVPEDFEASLTAVRERRGNIGALSMKSPFHNLKEPVAIVMWDDEKRLIYLQRNMQ